MRKVGGIRRDITTMMITSNENNLENFANKSSKEIFLFNIKYNIIPSLLGFLATLGIIFFN